MSTLNTTGAMAVACVLSFAVTPALAQTATQSKPLAAAELATVPVSSEELANLSGGDSGVTLAVSTQNATNTGNQINANSVVTGGINISQDAFSSFSGLGNIIMNTGNNNNIQTSMTVSISMPPR